MKRLSILGVSWLMVISIFLTSSAPVLSQAHQTVDALSQLKESTDSSLTIGYHTETGLVNFIGTEQGKPLQMQAQGQTGALVANTAEGYTLDFLTAYGSLFGLKDPPAELAVMKIREADNNLAYVRYQQVYQGIPVLGGELIVAAGKDRSIHSASGEILPGIQIETLPSIRKEQAVETAVAVVVKEHGVASEELTASQPELWIYNPALLGGPGLRNTRLVWKIEVASKDLLPINELVLVDAHLGAVALHFNQVSPALNRLVYDNNNDPTKPLPGTNLVRTEGSLPTYIIGVDRAYNYSGDTYNFYSLAHNRDSINNAGMAIISTVNYCPNSDSCPYGNAFWNGAQMVYGQGYASADDVVAHELTHGVTQYESHLFYYMQSGAINESFSDIWGEFVDLYNGVGNDSDAVKWLMGEDLPYSAIRSMKNPPLYNDPDKMTSSLYVCGPDDNGGVHSNSGVGNKAAYLMAEGGTFNGYTVLGIGNTKVARIWYHVQANMLTSGGDYYDLYNNLNQACTSLIGGAAGVTPVDCYQVRNATLAVEMHLQPQICSAPEVSLCPDGGGRETNLFSDNLENIYSGKWAKGAVSGSIIEFYYPQNPNPYSFDATYSSSGIYNIWGYATGSTGDYYIRMNQNVSLPAGKSSYLHFKHSYNFEGPNYDGGVIEYSTNGGATWQDLGTAGFSPINGYKGAINWNYGNPLGWRQGFIGESNGYISTRMTLTPLAGQSVRFRFRIGTDSSNWDYGWFIDDINIYTCTRQIYIPVIIR